MKKLVLLSLLLPLVLGTASRAIVTDNGTEMTTALRVDLDAARVYPNPWRADKHSSAEQVTFDQLPSMATVQIFTISGAFVKTLSADNGKALWDLTNDNGQKIASGIYLYVMATDDGQEHRGKLAVIK